MKTATTFSLYLLLSAFTVSEVAIAQAPGVKVTLDTPKGWTGETITLPPGFAKEMTWKGVETIRFAPGMFQPDSESFFSYAFIFWLPETKDVDQKAIERELLRYYRGLAAAVARGRELALPPEKFEVKVVPEKDSTTAWHATLQWSEPFVTRQKQTLYFQISARQVTDTNGTLLSIGVSPGNHESAIWKELKTILKSAAIE